MGRPPKNTIQSTANANPLEDITETEILNTLQSAISEDVKNQKDVDSLILPIPSRTSVEWSDYVLGLFAETEVMVVFNKNKEEIGRFPRVHGLRRLAQMLLGDIIVSKPQHLSLNYNIAESLVACAYSYTIIFDIGNGKTKEYSDVGEVIFGPNSQLTNNIAKYAKFPSAVAATRAEARALRKALGLNVIAAEEFDRSDVKENDSAEIKYISEVQKKGIEVLCKRFNIDVNKYIFNGVWFTDKGSPQPYGFKDINKIFFSEGAKMWKQLEAFQRTPKELAEYTAKYNLAIAN